MNRKIHFEDRGQDFLTWTIDVDGKMLACEPFQHSIWNEWTVMNVKGLVVGGKVQLTKPGYVEIMRKDKKTTAKNYIEITYPIKKVEILK